MSISSINMHISFGTTIPNQILEEQHDVLADVKQVSGVLTVGRGVVIEPATRAAGDHLATGPAGDLVVAGRCGGAAVEMRRRCRADRRETKEQSRRWSGGAAGRRTAAAAGGRRKPSATAAAKRQGRGDAGGDSGVASLTDSVFFFSFFLSGALRWQFLVNWSKRRGIARYRFGPDRRSSGNARETVLDQILQIHVKWASRWKKASPQPESSFQLQRFGT
jgi:hypothetical protein